MKAVFRRSCALALAASLAACATSDGTRRGVEVTTFHLGQPVARGQISIEGFEPTDEGSLEFRAYAAAVARQLTRLGWTVVQTSGQSEQVAMVVLRHGVRPNYRRSPVTVGVGGGTGGWSSGVGGGVSFPIGGGPREIVGNMLEVRIKRRSDGTVFWEGRAMSETPANRPEAQPAVAVERLAEALFRGFPGNSGQTIRVR
jgi:hypothetical protein